MSTDRPRIGGSNPPGTLRLAATTHIGKVRSRNEDCIGISGLAAPRVDGELTVADVSS
jgi:hypothetical protein